MRAAMTAAFYDAVIASRIDGVIARGNDTVNAAVIAARNAS